MSAELWQDSAATREKLVLELQHETTARVWQLQQQAQEVSWSHIWNVLIGPAGFQVPRNGRTGW